MQKNNKIFSVLSMTAIAAILTSAVSIPVYAADGDIYSLSNLSTPAYTQAATANFATQAQISLNSASYGYAHSGKVYKFDDLTAAFMANGQNLANTLTALPTAATPFGTEGQVAGALAVQSVSAINASQIKVVFNGTVDSTASQLITNYMINNVAAAGTAVLQADAKTVIITLAAPLTNGATYVYQVNPVASKADATVTSPIYTTTQKIANATAPTVTSVTSSTNGSVATSVTVNFSEPVVSGIIKIDGASTVVVPGTSQTITGLSLDTTKTHTLEYLNLTDAAIPTANVTAYATTTFAITKDVVVPTATVAAYGDKQILITFSKAMSVATVNNANIKAASESLSPYTLTIAPLTGDTTGTKFVATITTAPIYSTAVTSHVVSIAFNGSVQDTLGNAQAAVTTTVKLNKDTTVPAVTGIVAQKDAAGNTTAIIVKYSKPLTGGAAGVIHANLLTVVDSNGISVPAGTGANTTDLSDNDVVNLGDTQVRFAFATPALHTAAVENAKWNITVPAGIVEDESEGLNVSTGLTQLVDMSQPATAATFVVAPGAATIAGQVITVTYPSAVKGGTVAGSATDPNNYSINGTVLPAGTSITLNALNQPVNPTVAATIATITLPAGTIAANDTNAVFRIANVQNSNGTVVTAYLQTIAVTDNTAPVFTAATLNSNGTVSLGFSGTVNAIAAGTPADFKVTVNGSTLSVAGTPAYSFAAGTGADAGKYVLSISTKHVGIAAVAGTVTGTNGISYTGSATNVMKFTYIDVDGNGALNAGDIVLSAVDQGNATAIANATDVTPYNLNSASTLSISTVAAPATVTNTDAVALKGSTTITVK